MGNSSHSLRTLEARGVITIGLHVWWPGRYSGVHVRGSICGFKS